MQKFAAVAVIAVSLMGALGARPALAADAWNIDPVHSAIVFNITHNNGAGLVYGRFDKFTGTIMADANDPSASSIEVHVDASSVDTAVEPRDKHLKTADFFNVEKFAELTFKSTSVKANPNHPGVFEVTGDLTMLGVSKPLTITVKQHATTSDKKGNQITGFETSFVVKRSEWGMNSGIPNMSDDVNVMLAFECDKVMAAAPVQATMPAKTS